MSKKTNKVEKEPVMDQYIYETPIDEVMSQGFGRYSKYVLQERAVPDVRDGLKPVQSCLQLINSRPSILTQACLINEPNYIH